MIDWARTNVKGRSGTIVLGLRTLGHAHVNHLKCNKCFEYHAYNKRTPCTRGFVRAAVAILNPSVIHAF